MKAALILGGVALAAIAAANAARAQGPAPTPTPTPLPQSEDYAYLQELAGRAQVPGLPTFLTAIAYTESRGRSWAHNDSTSERDAARRLYEGAKSRGFYSGNSYTGWDLGSGGWYGLLPATGLSAGGVDGPFRLADPRLVFDPESSTAMAADLVARLVRSYGARDWWAVKRGWLSHTLVDDVDAAQPQSQRAHEHLRDAAEALGIPISFFAQPPDIRHWDLWSYLAAIDEAQST